MKAIRIILMTLFLGFLAQTAVAQDAGMEFFHGTWQEVLDESKKQRKLIFVDAYTTWCGPCKMMSRNTFTDAAVGDIYNKNFVNYKFDMEKGEGPAWARQYGITAYPTLFFINYKGEVVHKVVGFRAPDKFIKEAEVALRPENLAAYDRMKYKAGDLEGEKLLAYAVKMKAEGEDYQQAARDYFDSRSKKQMLSRNGFEAIKQLTYDVNSAEFQLLLKKRKKYIKQVGQGQVDAKIADVFKKNALKAGIQGDEAAYRQLVEMAAKAKDKGKTAARIKITYAEAQKNWDLYARSVVSFFEKFSSTQLSELQHISKLFLKHVNDKEQLETALNLSRQATSLKNSYENNDLYARLLFKAGKSREAYQFANKAITIAQEEGEEFEMTEELLKQIKRYMK
jgi:thiol:disulfide interchange protein